jgi:hypothetical protein
MWMIWRECRMKMSGKSQMSGQYREPVQKEKKTNEQRSDGRGRFQAFLWKLEADSAKGDELEIEQVVKKLQTIP